MTRPILFASDVHLSEDDHATCHSFISFLRGPACGAQSLYLLGDLFEYWAGDDDDAALPQQLAEELAQLAASGVRVYILHGNRDFLLGSDYAVRAGVTLLTDPHMIDAFDQRLILSHGDELCTDDAAYQAFRATVRHPDWQKQFLAYPLSARKAEIARLRAASKMANQEKSLEIMDVNDVAVSRLLARFAGAHLIHGHTHRPGQHQHEVQHSLRRRWVLPDWHDGRGGYLQLDGNGIIYQKHPA